MNLVDEIIPSLLVVLLACGVCLCDMEGSRLCLQDNVVVHRINQVTFEQCQEECGKRRHCKAINYKRLFKLCELLGADEGEHVSSHASKKTHCLFLKKSEMINEIIAAGCKCSDGLTCDSIASTCTITECPKIEVTNGQVFGNMFSVGARVKYTCNHGYVEVKDEMYSVCEASGLWSYQPNCIRECGSIPTFPKAMKISSGDSTTEGAVVQYQCESGYTFNGNSDNVTCTADGIWVDQADIVCVQIVDIGDPCVSHSDCMITEGICVDGKCFCSPLYRYKPEINDCVQECSSFTDTFTKYPGTTVLGYNDVGSSYTINDAQECEDLCLSASNCLSYEVWKDYDHGVYKGLRCNMGSTAYYNILDADPDSVTNYGLSNSIYNRDCI